MKSHLDVKHKNTLGNMILVMNIEQFAPTKLSPFKFLRYYLSSAYDN